MEMFARFLVLFLVVVGASCSVPETPIWNERETAKSVRMPAEAITKVVVLGNLKTLIRNPVSSNKKRLWMYKKRSEIVAGDVMSFAEVDQDYRERYSLEEHLDKIGLPERVGGYVDYLIDGEAFFSALKRSVDEARDKIDTRVFIFDNDDLAVAYANHLKQRSKDVRCRVIMDELGSLSSWWVKPESSMPDGFRPPVSIHKYLKQGSSVSVRLSKNPGLVTDHTKLFLFDEKEAYLGGMNIGREYRVDWHDMMVRVRGPVVKVLQNDFNKAWRLQGRTGDWTYPIKRSLSYRKGIEANELGIRVLKTSPGKLEVERAIVGAIRMARNRVYIQNSYFTSNSLERELRKAAERGVDVRMVFPAENDSKILAKTNRHFADSMIKAGAKVYAYPKFSHVKALVVDDWVCVGSANFDALSMRINEELNISFTGKRLAEDLISRLFKKDIANSKRLYEIEYSRLEKSWLKPIADQL